MRIEEGREWAFDDTTGAELDPILVKKARELEMEYFRSMGVYEKVHRSEAIGAKIIRTRWIDVNKGDSLTPEYRRRLVGKEFNDGVNPDSTPPRPHWRRCAL